MTGKNEAALGAIGSEVVMPVISAAGRQTIVADQVVVGTSADAGVVEMILLRNEIPLPVIRGVVVAMDNGSQGVRSDPQFSSQMIDLGHVRLTLDGALEMAVSVLAQAQNGGKLPPKELVRRLKAVQIDIS